MGRRIIIASGKGGAGKTTITAGLGLALANIGANVVLVDGDIGLSNLDTLLDIDGKVVFDLSDIMSRKCRIKQAIIQSSAHDNLYVIAGSRSQVGSELDEPIRFSEITKSLAEVFDYVLIDAPAGAGSGFKTCLAAADEAIIVLTPHIVSIRDADKILGVVLASGIISPMMIINRIRGDLVISKNMLSHTDISAVLSAKLVGIIPESDTINVYSSLSFTRFLSGDIEKAFFLTATNLHKNRKVLFDYKKKYKGIKGFFKRKMLQKGAWKKGEIKYEQ